jgi:hypothetical protein
MKYFTAILFMFLSFLSLGQQNFTFDQSISISGPEGMVNVPFSPGINAAQINEMDTNGDGVEEMVIWDINSRRILVFAVDEDGGWNYLPEMGFYFPSDVNGFLVLVDFDSDGRKDLFTSSPFGIKAYRNVSSPGSAFPQWEVAQNFLRLDNGSNVTANNLDTPLIADIDGDGDLDILTFNFAIGDYIEFYRNTSMERKGSPDIDGFAFPEARWGGFEFCDCGSFSFGVTCSGMPIGSVDEELPVGRILHAGGHSLLYSDFDGDGVKDLLMGQDECNTLYYLPNKGSSSNPIFDEFQLSVPGFGTLPEFPVFHAAALWKERLIVSSLASGSSAAFQADYSSNIFQSSSENTGFKPFIQDQLLDLGENSRPFFRGFANEGELIVTSNAFVDGKVVGKASLIGVEGDNWQLKDSDYQGLSELGLLDLQYLEYQSQGGGLSYWLIGTDTVDFSLSRRVFKSNSPDLEQRTEVSISSLQLMPLDQIEFFAYEGKNYLLLSRQLGELILLSANDELGAFEIEERQFLGFADNPANRNLQVHVIAGSQPSLYAIDQRGILNFIPDFMNQAEREQVQVRAEEDFILGRFGRITPVSSMGLPFENRRDLILGAPGGGIEVLRNESTVVPPAEGVQVNVFPNPSQGVFSVLSSSALSLRIVNTLGQVIAEDLPVDANRVNSYDFSFLQPGIYILDFRTASNGKIVRKLIVRP